jgi:hypothetical protein
MKRHRSSQDRSKFGRFKRILLDPHRTFGALFRRVFLKYIKNDETFIKWEYYFRMRKRLNLKNPKTYNEKLQWMKLYDRNPDYVRMVDKSTAKDWVAEKLGTDKYCIPTLGIYDNFEDIDFDVLPNQFVLKTTHDCGGIIICKDKSTFDIAVARDKLNKHLARDYFLESREWPYKMASRRIMAEKHIEDNEGQGLKDYKFFCFNGEPKFMFIATGRGTDLRFDFFDIDFNLLPFEKTRPNSGRVIAKPDSWDEMLDLSRKLSRGMCAVRVDLYDVNGTIFFGEMTLFSGSGYEPFEPEEWDSIIGEWLVLPE